MSQATGTTGKRNAFFKRVRGKKHSDSKEQIGVGRRQGFQEKKEVVQESIRKKQNCAKRGTRGKLRQEQKLSWPV